VNEQLLIGHALRKNMRLSQKALADIERADVIKLCADQEFEGPELEYKRGLPAKGNRHDPWLDNCQGVGEHARNDIAKEVVAFANTYGGVMIIGIEETKDKPNRAKDLSPLPHAHELARRLRQSIYDVIDPPLSALEAGGVVTSDDGTSGVVIIRVPPSRRRPHRLNPTKEVYVRRADESVPVDMRQIQELTIQSLTEGRRVEDELSRSREAFHSIVLNWLGSHNVTESTNHSVTVKSVPNAGSAFQLVAIPTAPIELQSVAARPDLLPQFLPFKVTLSSQSYDAHWPLSTTDWRPTLRAIFAESSYSSHKIRYDLRTDGRCELYLIQKQEAGEAGFFVEWLVAALAGMLFWIERIRRAAGVPAMEYALGAQFDIVTSPALLAPYGANNLRSYREVKLPVGRFSFPLASISTNEEFETLLQRFDEDIWNCAGQHFPTSRPSFDLQPHRARLE
jgi:schlafen family protein